MEEWRVEQDETSWLSGSESGDITCCVTKPLLHIVWLKHDHIYVINVRTASRNLKNSIYNNRLMISRRRCWALRFKRRALPSSRNQVSLMFVRKWRWTSVRKWHRSVPPGETLSTECFVRISMNRKQTCKIVLHSMVLIILMAYFDVSRWWRYQLENLILV